MPSDREPYELAPCRIAPLGLFYLQQVIAPEKSPSPTVESDLESWPGVAQLYALIDKEAAPRVEQFGPSAARGPEMASLWRQHRRQEDRKRQCFMPRHIQLAHDRTLNRRQRIPCSLQTNRVRNSSSIGTNSGLSPTSGRP